MLLAWKAFSHTLRDLVRDRLFDLRDEVRERFPKEGWGLDDPLYAELRKLINAHIRYIERCRFVGLLYLVFSGNKGKLELAAQELEERLRSTNPEQDIFIQSIRNKAVREVQIYMVCTSLTCWVFMACVFAKALYMLLTQGAVKARSVVARQLQSKEWGKRDNLEVISLKTCCPILT